MGFCAGMRLNRRDIKKKNRGKIADNFIKGWRMRHRNTKNIQIREGEVGEIESAES